MVQQEKDNRTQTERLAAQHEALEKRVLREWLFGSQGNKRAFKEDLKAQLGTTPFLLGNAASCKPAKATSFSFLTSSVHFSSISPHQLTSYVTLISRSFFSLK